MLWNENGSVERFNKRYAAIKVITQWNFKYMLFKLSDINFCQSFNRSIKSCNN